MGCQQHNRSDSSTASRATWQIALAFKEEVTKICWQRGRSKQGGGRSGAGSNRQEGCTGR